VSPDSEIIKKPVNWKQKDTAVIDEPQSAKGHLLNRTNGEEEETRSTNI
jgi:hypothetical protein